jgi:class 3 adenylate cyclase
VLLGEFSGGQLAMMFAAMHPERTSALVLANTWARALHAADHPIGSQLDELPPPHVSWGTGDDLAVFAPSVAGDERVRAWYARRQRLAISPNAVLPISMMLINMDVRAVLPSISVPTLVLHRRENSVVRVEHGRHLAEHIDGATLVELPGRDQLLYAGDMDQLVDEIELFLTGEHHQPRLDRMLATVLFTDIVSSTEHAAEMGDRRWRASLDSHDAMMRRQFDRYAGHEIKTTGDGFLATFDSPARAIRCAAAIVESARRLGLDVRAGLHTGECERRGADIGGIAVHIAQRVCAAAGGGEVVVSSTVCDIVAGSDLEFDERGQHTLKGVPGRWSLFTLRG